jgi:putative glutamine amidotransferase
MRPRIGITCSTTVNDERDLAAVETAYVAAVSRAGGLPFVLPILDAADAAESIAFLDGLVLAGGGDIDPELYGQVAVPEVHGVDRRRDLYEIALLEAATRQGLPVFGICRGLQVINVARGGTLVQDVPTITGVVHRIDERAMESVHPVTVVAGTAVSGVIGASSIEVNSLHHQAVDEPGRALEIGARAHDGTVEAVASTGDDRILGVQWHPELLPSSAVSSALFGWLVGEATRPPLVVTPTVPRLGASVADIDPDAPVTAAVA